MTGWRRVSRRLLLGVATIGSAATLVSLTACGPKAFFVSLLLLLFNAAVTPEIEPVKTLAMPGEIAFLAAAAHIAGAADTDWRSDIELHNVANEPALVTVALLVHGADNTTPATFEQLLTPRTSIRIGDVLMTGFGVEDKAALKVTTAGGMVIATDRTYNLLGPGNGLGLPAGATFGQYIPLRNADDAIRTGGEARLIGLAHDDHARTNLGLLNVMPTTTRVRSELYRGDGSYLGRFHTELAPFEYRQITRVFERVTSGPVAAGTIVVSTTSGDGGFLADASVVDAVTGDPVYLPAIGSTPRAGHEAPVLWIVAAAHTAGVAGTNWRTDLTIHNPTGQAVSYRVDLLPPNRDNSSPRSVTRSVAAGASARHADVLVELFGFEGTAALRIVPDGAPLLAASRTYNLLGPGNPAGLPAGATFGQFIPGVTAAAAVGGDWNGRLVHLAHDPGGAIGFRTNLVLVNLESDTKPLEVQLATADGSPLGTVELSLRPYELRQLNGIFERVTTAAVADGYATIRAEGQVLALGSVVDNLTGDPVGMMATRIAADPAAAGLALSTRRILDGLAAAAGDEGIEALVAALTRLGPDGIAAVALQSLPPGTTTVTGRVVTVDLADGADIDGNHHTGRAEFDFTAFEAGPEGLHGVLVATCSECTTNGLAATVTDLELAFDLAPRADGSVAGTLGITGTTPSKTTSVALAGQLQIDTAICLYYPIGGEVSFTTVGGDVVTIRFGPDCDGSFETDWSPRYDWRYGYGPPHSPQAQRYLAHVANAYVIHDVADYWIPEVGGSAFESRTNPGDTPPGVIVYRFQFEQPVLAAHLYTGMPAYHMTYSRAHNYLLGSADGVTWQQLYEIRSPENVYPTEPFAYSGVFDQDLPPGILGGTELWLRVELYCWGPSAPAGGTNTAQHARFWQGSGADTFVLEVDCAGAGCGDVQ